jgi:hypothetical protein
VEPVGPSGHDRDDLKITSKIKYSKLKCEKHH